mgnify:FL=1
MTKIAQLSVPIFRCKIHSPASDIYAKFVNLRPNSKLKSALIVWNGISSERSRSDMIKGNEISKKSSTVYASKVMGIIAKKHHGIFRHSLSIFIS